MSNQGKYKIKTVSELTGFSATLLRAWERRYDFLSPSRVVGKHRLYTEGDLKVLYKVRELLASGRSIGEVAVLGRSALLQPAAINPPRANPQPPSKNIPGDTRKLLLELVNPELQVHANSRWSGENLGVSLRRLRPQDLATVLRIYQSVHGYYELWLYTQDAPNPEVLNEKLQPFRNKEFQSQISQLGGSLESTSDLLVAALEDARWGALPALIERAEPGNLDLGQLQICALLARDHAKMLRNAFYDLDDTLTSADSSLKAHGLTSIISKLSQFEWRGLEVKACAEFQGAITSRCLETAALDRVLYDLLRRAGQSSPAHCQVWAIPLHQSLLRIALSVAGDFRPFETRDLATYAVANAVGVSREQALQQQYLGHRLVKGQTWAWFHWPTYQPPPGVHLCNCQP